jgi:DNA-binding protein YbaB
MTDNELALLASQRLPGFELVQRMASELRDARKQLKNLEAELRQAKAAATYGATMVKEMRDAL